MPAMFEADQTGKIPDLADIVANVESEECPYSSMAPKIPKLVAVKQTWQAEAYPVDAHEGVMDGKDADTFVSTGRSEIDGRAQKVWNNPAISDFAGIPKIAGVSKGEMANQIAKSLVRVKKIIERRLLSNAECSIDNKVDVPNATRGIIKWLQVAAQSVYPVPEAFRTPTACVLTAYAVSGVTESIFKGACRAAYKLRHSPSTLDGFIGIDLKEQFNTWGAYSATVSNFTAVRNFNQDAKSKTIQMSVDFLDMDTGKVRLHPVSYLYTTAADGEATAYTHRSGVFVDMSMIGLAFNRWPNVRKLENKGGGERAIVDAIFAHVVRNPLGHIVVLCSTDS